MTTSTQWCFAATLLCALCLVGCQSKPFSQDALAFVRPGETTRQEVVENFGQPTYESADHLLVAYAQETIRATVITPGIRWEEGVPKTVRRTDNVGQRKHALCFTFDSAQLVKRFQIISFEPDVEIATAVQQWGIQEGNP
jgi:hypothetical protein